MASATKSLVKVTRVCWRLTYGCDKSAFGHVEFHLLGHPQVRTYRSWRDKNFEIERRAEVLSELFDCDVAEVCDFLTQNKDVARMGQGKYRRIVQLFRENNISTREIFTYPDVFKRNCDTLRKRFEQLKDAGVEEVKLAQVNTTLPSFQKRLRMYSKEKGAKDVYSDTTYMIMSVLGCSRQEAQKLIEKNRVLKESKLSTLQTKIELLVLQGITPKLILEKAWILAQQSEKLEARTKFLRKQGITFQTCPKSFFFLIKCSEETLERNVQSHKEELAILGDCKTKEEFLCRSLNCDGRHVEILRASYPKLLSVGTAKLHASLTFLKDVGIPNCDVIAHGRIFAFSTETLKQRYNELSDLGCKPITARLLAMDSRIYAKLLSKLKCQLL